MTRNIGVLGPWKLPNLLAFECNLSISMFSTKIVAFTTMVLLVTTVVLSKRICFLRLEQIQNIKPQ